MTAAPPDTATGEPGTDAIAVTPAVTPDDERAAARVVRALDLIAADTPILAEVVRAEVDASWPHLGDLSGASRQVIGHALRLEEAVATVDALTTPEPEPEPDDEDGPETESEPATAEVPAFVVDPAGVADEPATFTWAPAAEGDCGGAAAS